jgi:hypothetical protein
MAATLLASKGSKGRGSSAGLFLPATIGGAMRSGMSWHKNCIHSNNIKFSQSECAWWSEMERNSNKYAYPNQSLATCISYNNAT